jgi:acyl-coenzyme A synthetase/AMP-(fatty) acid ligase
MKPSDPPEYFNFAEDVVAARARECPARTALLSVDEAGHETHWSFGRIDEQSSRLAHVLRANGLTRGATVLVLVASLPRRVIGQIAVMKAGGVSVLVRTRSTPREIDWHMDRASARLAIVGPEDAGSFLPNDGARRAHDTRRVLVVPSRELDSEMRAAPPHFEPVRVRSDEPVHIVLTGGTTGPPKMVVHTHGSKMFYYLRWTICFDPDDLSWDLSGRWWIGAWRDASPVFERAMPAEGRSETVLDTLEKYPITKLMAPPRLYSELVRHDLTARSFAALRTCWSAGQALDATVRRAWKEATGVTIYDRYNQTECGEAPFQPAADAAWKAGCLGKPFPWIEMAVIDDQGCRLPAGALGDIAIKANPFRPSWLFREYRGDPERTAARYRGDWYLTGDSGRTDEAGFFFFEGRADDVIICGAENIGPYELESVLLEHPAVREAAVVGSPDRDLGEVPKAFVVAAPGVEPSRSLADELLDGVNRAVHPSKRLRAIEFADALPRTAEGKIRRRELRERERGKLMV